MSRLEREALFHKCADTMTSESITGWFLRSPGRQIWRNNVVDWLLWALFSVRSSDTHPEWEDELNYYITIMGERVGYPLRPGSNPEMQCLRLTMDSVHMVHRPFVWYMVSFPLYVQKPHSTCGRSSALWIPSPLSRSISKASHTIIPPNGFTPFLHAHSLHCSRTPPGTQKPTYPIGTDHTARPRNSLFYLSTGLGLASYRTSGSSGSWPRRIRTSASLPLRFCPFVCTSLRRP